MDFAKAFDKVPHKHLLYKLKFYGINCNALNWISDFLADRTQTVVMEGEMSNKAPVTSGVPQGTVLGPIRFLIYINDFPDYLQYSTLRLFADDSIIYKEIHTITDAELLQSDLNSAVFVGVSAECEVGWREYYGNCYYVSDQRHRYPDSEVICAARNATIWVYHSQEELKWVSSLSTTGPRIMYWTGLKLVNHHWRWIDGTPYSRANVKWYRNAEGNKNAHNLCTAMYSYKPYVSQISQQNCRSSWGTICVRSNSMLDVCDLANGWRYIDGVCLRWYDTPATWFDARRTCQSQQGDLTMYKNYNQLLTLFDIVPCSSKDNMAWIGLSDTAHPRTWRWINNDTMRYQRWYSYGNQILQNGSTCAVTDPSQGYAWRGFTCDTQWKFICNRSVGVCPNGWLANQDRCYQAQVAPTLQKTWFDAKTYCEQMGTSLLVINSDIEQQFITKTLTDLKVSRSWLAFSDVNQSDVLYWTDGRAVVNASGYQHWETGYPRANPKMYDCGLITGGSDARWSHAYCFNQDSFVCEMKITDQPFIPTPAPVSHHCDVDWVLFDQRCYYFGPMRNQTLKAWAEALYYCKAFTGANLVVIRDPYEMAFVTVQQSAIVTAWIGLKYEPIDHKLLWIDGTAPGQNSRNGSNFYPGEPDDLQNGQQCIRIVGGRRDYSGSWDDGNCSLPQGFICEKAAYTGQVAAPTTIPPASLWSAWCGPNWVYNSIVSACYQVVLNSPKTWAQARADCVQKGGDLTSVSGIREQNFIQGMLGTGQYAAIQTSLWIGATDQSREGGWMWTDNSPFRYLNWHQGEPNNQVIGSRPEDCGELVSSWNYQWNDRKCDEEQLYICKKPANVATGSTLTPPTTAPITKSCVGEAMISGNYSIVDSRDFGASTSRDARHLPIYSRLLPAATGAWSAISNDAQQWISASFFNTIVMVGVTTAGRADNNEWVTKYKIQYQDSYYAEWLTYNYPPGKAKVFTGNTDASIPVTNKLEFPVEAKNVRLVPTEWNKGISLRWEILGCVEESCHADYAVSGPLVVADPDLTSTSTSYSNETYSAPSARLHPVYPNTPVSCWRPHVNDTAPWIQVDLTSIMVIQGVTIRGNPSASEWVTAFQVSYSESGGPSTFRYYQEPYGIAKVIPGNRDNRTPITYIFKSHLLARFVRIEPKASNKGGYIALAFDVLVCPQGCAGVPMISGSMPVDDDQLTASTVVDGNHGAFRSRLQHAASGGYAGAWIPRFNDRHQYIQVDLGYSIQISAIATQGASDSLNWVTSYALSHSDDGKSWSSYYGDSHLPRNFDGNWDNQMVRKHNLIIPVIARFVRLWPQAYHNMIALRWELYGCQGAITGTRIGCFADNRNAPDLQYEPYSDPSVGMWPPMCVDHCFRNGYYYAGIQSVDKCYCGNSYGRYGPANDCSLPCIPQTHSICGGRSSNIIYTTGLSSQFKVCPADWRAYRDQCYVLLLDRRSWYDARANCKKAGSDLASPNSEQEKDFVLSMLQSGTGVDAWIGLNDIDDENLFQWAAAGEVKYTNWNLNQPRHTVNANEDCVIMTTVTGGWQDEDCDTPHQYMCQMDKQPSLMPSPTPDVSGCPHGWDGYRWSCYLFADALRTHWSADETCHSLGSVLVHIDDRYEQAYLASVLGGKTGMYWTAVTDIHSVGTYGYRNGYLTYTNWAPNKPDSVNNCVAMGSSNTSGLWYNVFCIRKLRTVCEKMRIGYTSPAPPPMTAPPVPCDLGTITTNHYCYEINSRPPHQQLTWEEANLDCTSRGGSLATFHNASVMDAVWRQGLVGQASSFWIGLLGKYLVTGYRWTDNSPVQYLNWADGQPNPRNGRAGCVQVDSATSRWADQSCINVRSWICMVRRGRHLRKPTVISGPVAGDSSLCGPGAGWSNYHGSCYYGNSGDGNEGRTWRQAQHYCQQQGGDLVSITSFMEQLFVYKTVLMNVTTDSVWIGLNELDTDRGFRWSDGSSTPFINWALSEPNNYGNAEDCGALLLRHGRWNDMHCGYRAGFVCEKHVGSTPTSATPTTAWVGYCPPGYSLLYSRCYRVYERAVNWTTARAACQKVGHELASLMSSVENAFLTTLLTDRRVSPWLGLIKRQNHEFTWINQDDVVYTNFAYGEPNGNGDGNGGQSCVQMLGYAGKAGQWGDKPCDTIEGYVCMTRKDSSLPTPAPVPSICDAAQGQVQFADACYLFVPQALTWAGAQAHCITQGAYLTSINSVYEQSWIFLTLAKTNTLAAWTGLGDQQQSGVYTWVDGWPVMYTNWDMGEPTRGPGEGCVQVNQTGRWSDVDCNTTLPSVCKITHGNPPLTPSPPNGTCDLGWYPYGSKCYLLSANQPRTAIDAVYTCRQLGASLVSIHNATVNAFLVSSMLKLAQTAQSFWTSLHRSLDSGFMWVDGSPLQFTNWRVGQPSTRGVGGAEQNCGEVFLSDGRWNDEDCGSMRAYVCEKQKAVDTSIAHIGTATGVVINVPTPIPQSIPPILPSQIVPTLHKKTSSSAPTSGIVTPPTVSGQMPGIPTHTTVQTSPPQTQGTGRPQTQGTRQTLGISTHTIVQTGRPQTQGTRRPQTQGTGLPSLGTNMGTSTPAQLSATPAASTVLGMSSGSFAGIIIGAIIALLLAAGIALYLRRNTARGVAAKFGLPSRGFENKSYSYDSTRGEVQERDIDNGIMMQPVGGNENSES